MSRHRLWTRGGVRNDRVYRLEANSDLNVDMEMETGVGRTISRELQRVTVDRGSFLDTSRSFPESERLETRETSQDILERRATIDTHVVGRRHNFRASFEDAETLSSVGPSDALAVHDSRSSFQDLPFERQSLSLFLGGEGG